LGEKVRVKAARTSISTWVIAGSGVTPGRRQRRGFIMADVDCCVVGAGLAAALRLKQAGHVELRAPL